MRERPLVDSRVFVAAVVAVALGTAAPAASAEPAPPAAAPPTRPPSGPDSSAHAGAPAEAPDATRSRIATWAGLGLVVVGSAGCAVSTSLAVARRQGVGRMRDDGGSLDVIALLVNWGAAGGLAIGLPVMMVGALRNQPRSVSMAIAGIATTTVGAASLAVGSGFLQFGPDNPNFTAPGAALTAAGVAASAVGLGLYFAGNRSEAGVGRAARPAWLPVGVGMAPAHAGVAATWQF